MSPRLITWSETYSIGIPAIDDRRQSVLEVVNDMAFAAECGQCAPGDVACHLARLADCCSQHFKAEEELIEQWDFAEKAVHLAAHSAFRQALRHLLAHARKSHQRDDLLQLAEFVAEWQINHALKMDKRLARVFRVIN